MKHGTKTNISASIALSTNRNNKSILMKTLSRRRKKVAKIQATSKTKGVEAN